MWPHFNLITSRTLSSNKVTWGSGGWDFNTWILRGHNSAHKSRRVYTEEFGNKVTSGQQLILRKWKKKKVICNCTYLLLFCKLEIVSKNIKEKQSQGAFKVLLIGSNSTRMTWGCSTLKSQLCNYPSFLPILYQDKCLTKQSILQITHYQMLAWILNILKENDPGKYKIFTACCLFSSLEEHAHLSTNALRLLATAGAE